MSEGIMAGPPFELPYTLDLPLLELDRWRLHRDLAADSSLLVQAIRTLKADSGALTETDPAALALFRRLENGDRIRGETMIGPRIQELGGEAALPASPSPGFEADIRPLFRPMDVAHMKVFDPTLDLDDFASVKAKSTRILARLKTGMPQVDNHFRHVIVGSNGRCDLAATFH